MFIKLCRLEILKFFHRKFFRVSFLVVGLFGVLLLVGFSLFDFWQFVSLRSRGLLPISQQELQRFINGLLYCFVFLSLSSQLLLPILACLAGGQQVAGESKEGTLRAALVRPVSRGQFLLAKFSVSLLYVSVLLLVCFAVSLAVGVAVLGWGDLWAYQTRFLLWNKFGQVLGSAQAVVRLLCMVLSVAVGLSVLVGLSFFLSVVTDNPAVAVTGAFSLYVTSYLLERLPFFDRVDFLFFSDHMDFWKYFILPEIRWHKIYPSALYCILASAVLFAASSALFRRKDIHC